MDTKTRKKIEVDDVVVVTDSDSSSNSSNCSTASSTLPLKQEESQLCVVEEEVDNLQQLDEVTDESSATSDLQKCAKQIVTSNLPSDSYEANSTTKWEEEVLEDGCYSRSSTRPRGRRRRRRLRRCYDVNKLQKDYLYHHNRRKRQPLFKMFEWVERHMVLASLRST